MKMHAKRFGSLIVILALGCGEGTQSSGGAGGSGGGGGGGEGGAACPPDVPSFNEPCDVEGAMCSFDDLLCPGETVGYTCSAGVWWTGKVECTTCCQGTQTCADGHEYPNCFFAPECTAYACDCPADGVIAEGACQTVLGWFWDGTACVPSTGCSCVDGCSALYPDQASCAAAEHC